MTNFATVNDNTVNGSALTVFAIEDLEVSVELNVVALTGDVSVWVEFYVTEIYTIIDTGDLEFPVKYDVTGVGDLELPVEIEVFDGSFYFDFETNNAFRWSVIITLEVKGGDRVGESGDISEFLNGTISVEAEESAARIAEFTREPRPKGPCPTETDPEFLDLTKHIGRTVTIDYVLKDALGTIFSTERIFTGYVNEVDYDPVTLLTSYTCTDNRQQILENMDRSSIDAMMPGTYYSDFVFDPEEDNYVYAEDRLSTVPYALDLDRFGDWHFTQWLAEPSPIWKYDSGSVIYESVGITIETYRNITTEVEIEFNYRFLRLRERLADFEWIYPGSFCDYLGSGHTLPRKDMVVSAANGGSWRLTHVVFSNMPESQSYLCSYGDGVPQIWVNSGAGYAPLFTMGFTGSIAKRFRNNVTEKYTLTIRAPESLGQFGAVKDSMNVTVQPEFDIGSWLSDGPAVEEAYIERNPLIHSTIQDAGDGEIPLTYEDQFEFPFSVNGTDRYYDCIGDEIIDGEGRRADMENAMNTAIQVGKTKLLFSHRQHSAFWTTALMPLIELFHTVEVETCPVHARGKIRSFKHEMDLLSGQATTTMEIAVSKTTDSAVIETPTEPPDAPDTVTGMGSGTPSFVLGTRYGGQNNNTLFQYAYGTDPSPAIDDEPFNGYSGNRDPADLGSQIYPVQLQIITEAIDEADSEDIEEEQTAIYDVNIPDELMDLQA